MIDHDRWNRDGFLVMPGVVDAATCAALRERAAELVAAFEPSTVSIFSTNEQTRTSDEYFLESGHDVRFFFEEEAFAPDGTLVHGKARSINKIGHALHERDAVFAPFSRDPRFTAIARELGLAKPALVQSMYIFKNALIGGDVSCHRRHVPPHDSA